MLQQPWNSILASEASLGYAAASPEGEKSTLMLGPVRGIPAGAYILRFRQRTETEDPAGFVSSLEVVVVRHNQVLHKSALDNALWKDEDYIEVEVPLTTRVNRDLHFRFRTQGQGRLLVDRIDFLPAKPGD